MAGCEQAAPRDRKSLPVGRSPRRLHADAGRQELRQDCVEDQLAQNSLQIVIHREARDRQFAANYTARPTPERLTKHSRLVAPAMCTTPANTACARASNTNV